MSKLLWKILFVSPAVLGTTLLVSIGAVRAAGDASAIVAENQPVATAAAPAQNTAATELETIEPIANVIVPTAPVTQHAPIFSANSTPTLAEAITSEILAPVEVAATPSPAIPATSEVQAQAPVPEMPAAEATVAQATPVDPNNSEILQQIRTYGREGKGDSDDELDQVTNVTQLSDVSPGDWAFEALRSLVERYGCIVGYPDGTYRGNRALTRYEFAAGLNACLNQIERLIASATADFVRREDLETLQRLVQEFQAELATLGTRVDNLEGRVGYLEDNQFSTTTKLAGEAIFALTDEFNRPTDNNTVFQNRVRITLNTSFTGEDRLVTRLAAGNAGTFPGLDDTGLSSEGTQTFNIFDTDNDIVLDWLAYYGNFGSSKIYIAATGGIHSDYAPTLNPYFEDYDGGNGALSTFASESPIYRIGGGAGAAISLGVGPLESILGPSTLTVGYLAGPGAENPLDDNGVINGDYAALGQLNFNLGDRIAIGATYVHGYHNAGTAIFDQGNSTFNGVSGGTGVVGTFQANNPSAVANLLSGGALPLTPVVTNTYGVEGALRLTNNISISGYGAYTNAILIGQGTADIWTYGGGVAFSDFGKEGSVLGFFGGVQPTLRGVSENIRNNTGSFVRDNAFHVEGFYKYQVNDNISITPGVIWLLSPGQNEDADDALIGTLRTTFTF